MRTPITHRSKRLALVLATGALLATGATACEPPGPPPAFTVAPAATGSDTTPGDGICANADGRCSLQAAVEEANALDTRTTISVPDGAVAPVALEVTGVIALESAEVWQDLEDVSFTVVEDAQLEVTDASIGPAVVDGTLLARRVGLGDGAVGADALIEVGATGTVLLSNAQALVWDTPLTINAGVLAVHGATVLPHSGGAEAVITTAPGGQTRLSGTAFLGGANAAPSCAGVAPTSYGYNLAPDTTCGLAMTGDRQDFDETDYYPERQDDARVDAIPMGTLHCGAGWDDDISSAGGAVRPFDGDEDGTAACDIGVRELSLG